LQGEAADTPEDVNLEYIWNQKIFDVDILIHPM
jgi:hypothetical protein